MSEIESFGSYDNNGGVLKEQLNAEDVVYHITEQLLGKTWNYDTKKYEYYKGERKPYLSNEGVSKIASVLKARISNINAYSKLTTAEISCIRSTVIYDVWFLLSVKMYEYNLDVTLLSVILNIIDDQIHLFLSRTETGGFMQFIRRIFSSSETYTTKQEDIGGTYT